MGTFAIVFLVALITAYLGQALFRRLSGAEGELLPMIVGVVAFIGACAFFGIAIVTVSHFLSSWAMLPVETAPAWVRVATVIVVGFGSAAVTAVVLTMVWVAPIGWLAGRLLSRVRPVS